MKPKTAIKFVKKIGDERRLENYFIEYTGDWAVSAIINCEII